MAIASRRSWQMATKSLSGSARAIQFDPSAIRFKIAPINDLAPVQSGDWDLERRHLLADTAKHRAIVQRFTEGRDWEETDLFRDLYQRRIAAGGNVRGATTMEQLAAQYRTRVDGLYEDMRGSGFRLSDHRGRLYPLPMILIGRGGELFIGNQGNHRLAIAQLLGLSQITGNVTCKHALA